MMSAFVDKAMELAGAAIVSAARQSFMPVKYASACDKLRAHLEAREAVTEKLAEALKRQVSPFTDQAIDEIEDEYGLGFAQCIAKGREALQAYEEVNK